MLLLIATELLLLLLLLYCNRGYEIQFLHVDGIPLDDDGIPTIINTETHKPFADIPLAKEAETSKVPISFCYRYEKGDDEIHHYNKLPGILIIDDKLLNNALKEGSSYAIVAIAFSKVVSTELTGLCKSCTLSYSYFS